MLSNDLGNVGRFFCEEPKVVQNPLARARSTPNHTNGEDGGGIEGGGSDSSDGVTGRLRK